MFRAVAFQSNPFSRCGRGSTITEQHLLDEVSGFELQLESGQKRWDRHVTLNPRRPNP